MDHVINTHKHQFTAYNTKDILQKYHTSSSHTKKKIIYTVKAVCMYTGKEQRLTSQNTTSIMDIYFI